MRATRTGREHEEEHRVEKALGVLARVEHFHEEEHEASDHQHDERRTGARSRRSRQRTVLRRSEAMRVFYEMKRAVVAAH